MRILRDMAISGNPFNYTQFKRKLNAEEFSPGQKTMMEMRLNLLESFLDLQPINSKPGKPGKFELDLNEQIEIFAVQPGTLTIVDLTDPFLDPSTVCTLFDICLSLFEQNRPVAGLVVALDEAHKYMLSSSASDNFTSHLLTTIREQRHNAMRVLIAAQEPTISPKLLDLCSMTFVHRFTSPEWLGAIEAHLAAASPMTSTEEGGLSLLFEQIIELDPGQSLLFAPSAMLEVQEGKPKKLGARYVKIKTRQKFGIDAGKSLLAIRQDE